jgi:hypothetical protein
MLQYVIEKFIDLLPAFEKLSAQQRDMKDNALRSISHALNETYLYYRDIEKGVLRNQDIEAQLSRYWAAAAIPLRHIDGELAAICDNKSEYWINPDTWNQDKIDNLGINLEKVRNEYRLLLQPKKFSTKKRVVPN